MIKLFDPVSTWFPAGKTKVLPLTVVSSQRWCCCADIGDNDDDFLYRHLTTYKPKMQAVTGFTKTTPF